MDDRQRESHPEARVHVGDNHIVQKDSHHPLPEDD